MLTLKDISVSALKTDWKYRICRQNQTLNRILKEDIITLEDLTNIDKKGLSNDERQILINEIERLQSLLKELNQSQKMKPIFLGNWNVKERLSMEENMDSKILPAGRIRGIVPYSGWEHLKLSTIDHTLTTYTLKGNRTYQEKPYSVYFRSIKTPEISLLEDSLIFYLEQIERLKKEYPKIKDVASLFALNKEEKQGLVQEQWNDIVSFFEEEELRFLPIKETQTIKHQDPLSPRIKEMIPFIADYITPKEATGISTKTLSRFIKK